MKIINILLLLSILLPITTFLLITSNDTPVNNIIYLHEQYNKTIPAQQQLNALLNTHTNVMLQFYADWCNPCVNMSRLIAIVAPTMPNITIIKINRDHFMNLARAYGVTSIPTLIFMHKGTVIARYDGRPLTQEKLIQLLSTTFAAY